MSVPGPADRTPDEFTLARTLVEFTDTVDIEDIGAFTRELARRYVRMLAVTGAAVVLLDSSGRARLYAAYPEWIRPIPELAVSSGAGPVIECCRTATPATIDDTRTSTAWPRLAMTAHERGITAISTVPLRHREHRLGAVGLYLRTGKLSAHGNRAAQLLGDAAAVGLWNWHEHRRLDTLAGQLKHALDSRIVIEQAKGVIAERHRLTVADAFHRLRGFARSHRLPLHDVARQVASTTTAIHRDG